MTKVAKDMDEQSPKVIPQLLEIVALFHTGEMAQSLFDLFSSLASLGKVPREWAHSPELLPWEPSYSPRRDLPKGRQEQFPEKHLHHVGPPTSKGNGEVLLTAAI